MAKTRSFGLDPSVQATIITDCAIPPEGLGAHPSSIKLVLYCLRGLGAPGSDLQVHQWKIEQRTQLGDRVIRTIMGILRDQAILVQTAQPAPGRPACYRMDYARLADWLTDEDRERSEIGPSSNTGTTCRRSPAPDAAEHRHDVPPNKTTPARGSATPAPDAATAARDAADLKEVPAVPADSSISISAAADELRSLARKSGLSPEVSDSVARQLAGMGWTDLDRVRNDLERLAEAMARSSVRNPNGLLTTFLTGPLQPSDKALKRARKAEAAERKFQEFRAWLGSENRPTFAVSDAIGRQAFRLAVESLGEAAAFELMPEGRFKGHLCSEQESVQRFVHAHWETIRQGVERERKEARRGQDVAA